MINENQLMGLMLLVVGVLFIIFCLHNNIKSTYLNYFSIIFCLVGLFTIIVNREVKNEKRKN